MPFDSWRASHTQVARDVRLEAATARKRFSMRSVRYSTWKTCPVSAPSTDLTYALATRFPGTASWPRK
jgi:hypothetical protein